ncbi:ribonuclease D [Solimonas terrae]|uniref:Ribonuclease D n=1 Tax=Solimonas terrae TaxID=1396819 RepID=A0A6M2BTX9_9GAMM|nr:ribonuclease D [Solimonas terrae]NGY05834.1 ribonuclease D [Solimonas terrae]
MTTLIQNADTLAPHLERWAQRPWLTIDTEFVRIDTYYPKLCLIQIGDGEQAVCVDTLAFDDLDPLLDVLYAPNSIKVFHAAAQDLEILVRLRGSCPQPLFDTQIAATLLGIGDQIGYAGLIDKRLGITLDKSLSRTDWARRPLREAELAYAAADVSHLATIFVSLQDELAACGRLAWLAEDCARLADASAYVTQPADAWQRLRGLARMDARAQTVAGALAAWRETEAQARNRPRKWIIEDDAIYRMAERLPDSMAQLEALGALPPKTLERLGETLLAVIADARELAPRKLLSDDELTGEQKQRLRELQNFVQTRAGELQLPAGYLAPRADLVEVLRRARAASVAALSGWRLQVCGEDLLARFF